MLNVYYSFILLLSTIVVSGLQSKENRNDRFLHEKQANLSNPNGISSSRRKPQSDIDPFNKIENPQQQQQQQQESGDKHLVDYEECKEDISRLCLRESINLKSDMAVLECLQDVGKSEHEELSWPCEHLIWEFKVNLTSDARFGHAASQNFCKEEINFIKPMQECQKLTDPGFLLSCFLENMANVSRGSRCFKFLTRTERLAFSDFRLVGPFIRSCGSAVQRLQCGSLEPPGMKPEQRVKHSQGATVECLIEKVVKNSEKQRDALQILDMACRHELMRIAELQSEDFHLDRPLFFACREDREAFCKGVQSGEGRVFQCLLQHRNDEAMTGDCRQILSERAQLMGQNYRLSHPLVDGCRNEIQIHNCEPQLGDTADHFHLSYVLLCLENAAHSSSRQFSDNCKHEMISHRTLLMNDFRLSPELVLTCAEDIQQSCSDQGQLQNNGGTLHCLMKKASDRKKQSLQPQCDQALKEVMKVADIGSNYKVDRVLYASCRELIEGKCNRDAESESSTLTCLMNHVEDSDMTDSCEQRLLEIQYFLAREWTLDPELYRACHKDAVDKCHAMQSWHVQQNDRKQVDPGPQVLACLYRSAYDDSEPLSTECAHQVRRVLRSRAVSVQLLPAVEEACREALSEFCSDKTQNGEEMQCLQMQFELDEFKQKYDSCYKELSEFTKHESKDIKLNRALTKACKPLIKANCDDLMDKEIDDGEVMECLLDNKDSEMMTTKCLAFVNHFEMVSMRDYNFSPKFAKHCKQDIENNCRDHGSDKSEIIRCLSTVLFEHRVLGTPTDLSRECRKQLKRAYIEQERFDDDEELHIDLANPKLFKECHSSIQALGCKDHKSVGDIVECLREQTDKLDPECKAVIFGREKIEAIDNEFDDELQKGCKSDIGKFCSGYEPSNVLQCLTTTKIARQLRDKCRRIVTERMREQVHDDRLNPTLLESCKEEIDVYCKNERSQLNQEQYAKHQMEGIVVNCLRQKYAPKNPAERKHFSAKCESEVSRIILEAEFDIETDPVLFHACKDAIDRHCKQEVISTDGTVNTVIECLKADYYRGSIHNENCKRELARRTQEALVDINLDPLLHEACSLDMKHLCSDVQPGNSRVIVCLVEALQSTSARMTKKCRTQLTERNNLWQQAHQDFQMVLPSSVFDVAQMVANSPARDAFVTIFLILVVFLFVVGCCCGRVTKRVRQEIKNK